MRATLVDAAYPMLDQSAVYMLDHSGILRTSFVHGTMIAGLVHLVAPHATIMPYKAFDITGAGTEWNITHAIYDAVDANADVISMSFSSPQDSPMIDAAIEYAVSRGVVLVGASGNDNSEAPTFPASLGCVVGISSLDLNE